MGRNPQPSLLQNEKAKGNSKSAHNACKAHFESASSKSIAMERNGLSANHRADRHHCGNAGTEHKRQGVSPEYLHQLLTSNFYLLAPNSSLPPQLPFLFHATKAIPSAINPATLGSGQQTTLKLSPTQLGGVVKPPPKGPDRDNVGLVPRTPARS